jgi:bifunctional non-homologous end joining protein LigD
VRLFTRRGQDWTDRYPAIAAAAAKLRAKSFALGGEAVVCGPDDASYRNH